MGYAAYFAALTVWLLAAGCGAVTAADSVTDDTAASAVDRGASVFQFTFVVYADPHVTADDDNAARLRTAVAWTNAHRIEKQIDLVLLAGDITWDGGFALTYEILSQLEPTWVPLNGDNGIHTGDEEEWNTTFSAQFDSVASQVDNWRRAPVPIDDPVRGADTWYQNWAFENRGVTFVGLDWSPRGMDGFAGEMAALNPAPGGTLDWFTTEIGGLHDGFAERAVMLTHQPMVPLPGGFFPEDQLQIDPISQPVADYVWGDVAGHLHVDSDIDAETLGAGYEVHIIDAIWDDTPRVGVISVSLDDVGYTYVVDRADTSE